MSTLEDGGVQIELLTVGRPQPRTVAVRAGGLRHAGLNRRAHGLALRLLITKCKPDGKPSFVRLQAKANCLFQM